VYEPDEDHGQAKMSGSASFLGTLCTATHNAVHSLAPSVARLPEMSFIHAFWFMAWATVLEFLILVLTCKVIQWSDVVGGPAPNPAIPPEEDFLSLSDSNANQTIKSIPSFDVLDDRQPLPRPRFVNTRHPFPANPERKPL
jgi:hypothetical protein